MIKKLMKWFFHDRIVIVFMVIGAIFLALTLNFNRMVDPIKYGDINYGVAGTAFHQFLLKMSTPALVVQILLRGVFGKTAFLSLVLYLFMFVVQIILYGFIGKVVSVLFSNWIVFVFMITGIILLALALAFGVGIEGSRINDPIEGTVFWRILCITTLPAWIGALLLLRILRVTTFLSIIFYPFMFVVQILLYWVIGKVVGLLYRIVGGALTHAFGALR